MATVSVGTSTACAVSTAGAVSCWGDDGSGEIGDGGSESQAPTPVAVSGLSSGVKKVSVDSLATCALLSSGGLKCSGDGFYGELATGLQAASSNVPVDIAGFTSGVADVVVGYEHVCAVRTVGTVACWGQNDQGEDSGPNSINYSPVDVPGLSNVAAISGTGRTSCALTSAGGVFCWGAEPLGDDGQGAQNVPQPAYDLSSGATSLASGGSQRCVVMKDGSVSYWGALVPSSPGLSAQVPQPL
jgi:alpha-tubulin suppressor-like RCC1 family protein